MHPDVVLFDLDGTLTESGPGILKSLAYALESVGAPPLHADVLRRFIGPPLRDSFREIAGLDDDVAREAMEVYRSDFIERGMYENAVYPHIPALLRRLRDDGRRLAVATSKPLPAALPIIEHFALRHHFEGVFGPEDDDAGDKKAVVTDALANLGVGAATEVVLVGDRSHDVVGAHDNGIACIGVLWGYGSRDELESAGADAIASDVDELASLLGVRLH